MKKIVGFTLMLISSVVMANNNNIAANAQNDAPTVGPLSENTIRIKTRPEIIGLWGMDIPNNRKCMEYYNFKAANNVVINSGDEWSTGIYDYQPPEDPNVQLPALVLQIKYDNNEKDCSGQQVDQTGEISQYYVQWKSPNMINFCSNDKAQECFATLRRVLP